MNRRPASASTAVTRDPRSRPRLRQFGRYRLDHQLLGKGNFARVELATHTILGLKVAVKMIDKSQITEDYVRRNLGREARIMARLRHPHIAALYEAIESGHLVCLVTELAPGGDLCSHVKAQPEGRLDENSARPFLAQIVSALVYMHGRGVIHRDLKMENVMLDETKSRVKIVDFGLSNFYGPGVILQTHCGSPEYAAPELFIPGRPYGPEVDVWSLGVIMYGALTGCLPFLSPRTDGNNAQERRHRLYRKIQQGLGQHHWKTLANVGNDCRDLLLSLLAANPEKRIKLEDVRRHSYITAGNCPPVDVGSQSAFDHPDAEKVFLRLSGLLALPISVIEAEIERDDHCEIAAMFYLLLASVDRQKSSCRAIQSPRETSTVVASPLDSPENDVKKNDEEEKTASSTISAKTIPEPEVETTSLLRGAGEADKSVANDPQPVKVETGILVASGDGATVDETSTAGRLEERPPPPRGLTGRRLSLRHLCFKRQSSDASLTSRLLLDKQNRRNARTDDDKGGGFDGGKRRPRTSGDSCFCMLNYANRWYLSPRSWWNPGDDLIRKMIRRSKTQMTVFMTIKTKVRWKQPSTLALLNKRGRWRRLRCNGPRNCCRRTRLANNNHGRTGPRRSKRRKKKKRTFPKSKETP